MFCWLVCGLDILNSRQNRSKNKLVRGNAVTRVHGSCSLQVMSSWLIWKRYENCRHHDLFSCGRGRLRGGEESYHTDSINACLISQPHKIKRNAPHSRQNHTWANTLAIGGIHNSWNSVAFLSLEFWCFFIFQVSTQTVVLFDWGFL